MFKCNDYRVKDLDEIVPLVKKEDSGFDPKKGILHYFKLGKKCHAVIKFDKKTNQTQLILFNAVLNETRTYGGENPLNIEAIDIDSVMENFVMFDYFVSGKSIFGKKNADAVKIHSILSNVDSLLAGGAVIVPLDKIVSAEEYEKAIAKAKKAFDKEQSATIDSQTPEYDS